MLKNEGMKPLETPNKFTSFNMFSSETIII